MAATVSSACMTKTEPPADPPSVPDPAPEPPAASGPVYLDQGWTGSQRAWFYTTSQGSRLMPHGLFMALEQAEAEAKFVDPEHLRQFRWLFDYAGSESNDGLPIGVVRDGEHVGLTCSACHTGQLEYEGTTIRIDGGAAMVDVEGFSHALTAALAATLEREDKFERLAQAMLGDDAGDEQARATLRAEVQAIHDERAAEDTVNRAMSPYGFARLDAFGRIFNRAMRLVSPHNGRPSAAPVSFPVLWDTPAHDYVQWSAFAANARSGALQRNVGQIVGVYGELELTLDDPRGYPSSVDVPELIRMEQEIAKLQSPEWPAELLGTLDADKLRAGEALYTEHCETCHARIDRADPERSVTAHMVRLDAIQTDPAAAMNIVTNGGLAGPLEGKLDQYGSGNPIGPEALAIQVVGNLIGGVMQYAAANDPELAEQLGAMLAGPAHEPRQGDVMEPTAENPLAALLAYKARPLNGVWASAPYLHNGSVPSLHDLLLPPAQRPARFWVGSFAFDPVKVGFVSERSDGAFEFDVSVPGNANVGHDYGTELSEAERLALLEYLKSL